jgi:hypothetical protein
VSRRAVGAGAVAAGTALIAAIGYIPVLWVLSALYPGIPRTTDLYFFLYSGFTFYASILPPLVGLIVGTVVWKRMVSSMSNPSQGAIAGIVTALATVLFVPMLFSLLLLTTELVRAVWWSADSSALFGTPSELFIVLTHGGVVYWNPFAGLVLVPLGALVGWAYPRGHCPRSR